ncbi:hypothetical protein HF086_016665 [Spodoptera exigua]|uniref:dihydrofolate reductase n=1 Tax=Spodoptera exigua TaxID=7107 RepID=A0A922S9M0_SPOEX|nr:hypothetical protein HF086_016665 [Spodoptera exigua]
MSRVKLNLIAAACENMGIGVNGALPWRLKKEMAYFTTMTTKVKDPSKVNAVIMGRRTWDCIPDKYRPLSDRVNIVLTHNVDAVKEKAAMTHPNCGKIYLTEIQKSFDCDTFFPNIDKQQFHLVNENEIPEERQSEGEISYFFRVYKRL